MFKTLYFYESYTPIETKIDSVIRSPYNDTTILRYAMVKDEAMKQMEECHEKAKKAMEIYNLFGEFGIENHRDPHKEFSEHMEKSIFLLKKSIAYDDSIRLRARLINPEFTGWAVTHRYCYKEKSSLIDTTSRVFIVDNDFTKIINIINTEDECYQKSQQIIKEILERQ